MGSFIFDMDGTLFQTDKISELALENAFDRLRCVCLKEYILFALYANRSIIK